MQLTKRLTDSLARSLPLPPKPEPKPGKRPATGQEIYWCKDTPGFGVRVTSAGSRAWIFERRVDGETKRRTIGKAMGRAAISADEARKQAIGLSADLQRGADPLEVKKQQTKAARRDVTLAEAVQQYVEGKVRIKDGKHLKERTKTEYLRMVAPGGVSRRRGFVGEPTKPGELYALANRRLSKITGDDIRELYAQLKKRPMRAAGVMRVLRAVLNWHGVPVPENPFSKDVPGRDRIVLPPTIGNPNPIPRGKLGAFWRAACAAGRGGRVGGSANAGACIRFVLLTGARGGESAGNRFVDGVLVRDFKPESGTIVLRDTKNRKDHTIYLSRQALELARELAKGKKSSENLLPVRDVRKTLHAICAAAEIEPRGLHEIRKTFATIAGNVVPHYTLKHMMNHSMNNDVTGEFYIGREEDALRAGWQAVADFIEAQAAASV